MNRDEEKKKKIMHGMKWQQIYKLRGLKLERSSQIGQTKEN
jgi:hypothetical protein